MGEAENAQQCRRMRQLINQPELRGRLHPRANQRNQLSYKEKLKVAMLQSAKARGHEREIPPSIGRRAPPSRRTQSFTMKPALDNVNPRAHPAKTNLHCALCRRPRKANTEAREGNRQRSPRKKSYFRGALFSPLSELCVKNPASVRRNLKMRRSFVQ